MASFETKHMPQLPYYTLNKEISIGMRASSKKLNIFMPELPIYNILELKSRLVQMQTLQIRSKKNRELL